MLRARWVVMLCLRLRLRLQVHLETEIPAAVVSVEEMRDVAVVGAAV
jgi:hypothetical protein